MFSLNADLLLPISENEKPFPLIVLAIIASLVAPFYGFLGSAVKRAVGVKDFGDLFPGHGGMTYRFDCNFGMATFTYMYVMYVLGSEVVTN